MGEIERIMSQVVKKHCGDYDCILPEREIDNTDFYRGKSGSCKKCAYNIILQALQEKAEREKQQTECKYCHDASFRQAGQYVDSEEGYKVSGINHYCINCGRRLGE